MATAQEVIKKFMKSLVSSKVSSPATMLNNAIKACSSFGNLQAVVAQMKTDIAKAGSAEKFLQTYCGLNFDSLDTGAISGANAGGTTLKTSESIVPESGALKSYEKNSFAVNKMTFKLEKDFSKLSAQEQFIWQAMYTWWVKGAFDLLEKSYGYSFKNSDLNFKNVTVKFVNDSSTTWLAWNHWYDIDSDGNVDMVTLNVNMRYWKNINDTNPNGYSSGTGFYLDKTLAHEFTHTLMHAMILNDYELPDFVCEGLSELTVGVDDERQSGITYLAKNPSVLTKWLATDYTKGKNETDYSYEAGYIFFRYLAKQASTRGKIFSNSTAKKSISGTGNEDTISNSAANVTISGGKGNDSIDNFGGSSKILGGDGADQIYVYGEKTTVDGGKNDDLIYIYNDTAKITALGGDGNDEIYSGAPSVSIDAGAGNDYVKLFSKTKNTSVKAGKGDDTIASKTQNGVTFFYANGDGNDLITGATKADTISITGGAYTRSVVGNDLIFGVGNGSITVKGAKNISLTVKGSLKPGGDTKTDSKLIKLTEGDDKYKNTVSGVTIQALGGKDSLYNTGAKTQIFGGKGNDSVFNHADSVTIDGGDDADYLSNFKSKVSIGGGAGNDSLFSSSVTSAVTLDGGAGNDYISSSGDKIFIRGGAGKDTLYNNENKSATIDGGDDNDYISNWGLKSSLVGGKGNDSIFNYDSVVSGVTVDGGDNNDFVLDRGKKSLIRGGAGDDSIYIYGTNPTVDGGDGNDYINSNGDKIFIRGGTGKDSIYIYGTNTTVDGGDGDDRIVNWGTAASNIGGKGNDTIYGNTGNDTLRGGADVDLIFGDAGNDKLFGDAGNDSLKGGYGDDTLTGGKGNDSLWGETGADKFIYANGDGKDVIFGFDNADLLEITGATFSTNYNSSKKEIYFNVGSTTNALTLKNFGSTTSFNVNGDAYKISGLKLVRK